MKQIDYLTANNNNDIVLEIAFQLLATNLLPVIICVGEKHSTDMFSKLVAELLIKKYAIRAYVYGRSENPITHNNLDSAVSFISNKHKGSKVFVVFSKVDSMEKGSILYYGKGKVFINSSAFGDYSLMTFFNRTPLLIGWEKQKQFKLAGFIAHSLYLGISYADAIKNHVTQKNTTA